jgi:hypothetical protein
MAGVKQPNLGVRFGSSVQAAVYNHGQPAVVRISKPRCSRRHPSARHPAWVAGRSARGCHRLSLDSPTIPHMNRGNLTLAAAAVVLVSGCGAPSSNNGSSTTSKATETTASPTVAKPSDGDIADAARRQTLQSLSLPPDGNFITDYECVGGTLRPFLLLASRSRRPTPRSHRRVACAPSPSSIAPTS